MDQAAFIVEQDNMRHLESIHSLYRFVLHSTVAYQIQRAALPFPNSDQGSPPGKLSSLGSHRPGKRESQVSCVIAHLSQFDTPETNFGLRKGGFLADRSA
jgi:hypothetical protein